MYRGELCLRKERNCTRKKWPHAGAGTKPVCVACLILGPQTNHFQIRKNPKNRFQKRDSSEVKWGQYYLPVKDYLRTSIWPKKAFADTQPVQLNSDFKKLILPSLAERSSREDDNHLDIFLIKDRRELASAVRWIFIEWNFLLKKKEVTNFLISQ
jgi:hypothetical protein